MVKNQTTLLQNQINDLLEFSRLEAGQVKLRVKMSPCPTSPLRSSSKLQPQAQEGQITLTSAVHGAFPTVQGDRAAWNRC